MINSSIFLFSFFSPITTKTLDATVISARNATLGDAPRLSFGTRVFLIRASSPSDSRVFHYTYMTSALFYMTFYNTHLFTVHQGPASLVGHPFAIAHRRTCWWFFTVAMATVSASHGHPCNVRYLSISRCPPSAAAAHVSASQGQPCARAHLSTGMDPPTAANAQITSQGKPHPRDLALPYRVDYTV